LSIINDILSSPLLICNTLAAKGPGESDTNTAVVHTAAHNNIAVGSAPLLQTLLRQKILGLRLQLRVQGHYNIRIRRCNTTPSQV
jgi:hypothetical protein